MPSAKLAIDGPLELRLNFWGDWSPHGKASDVVFEEDLDQLVNMAQFKWHSCQCHNPARGLHQQAILWCIKPQWMGVVNLWPAPFYNAPGD